MRMKAAILVGFLLVFSGVASSTEFDSQPGFYWRAGATWIALSSKSDEIVLSGLNSVADLAIDEGPIAGSGISVDGGSQMSVVLGYQVSDRWSLETIVAPPFHLDLSFSGTIRDESLAPVVLGFLPTGIEPLGENLGSIKSLPLVLTATYKYLEINRLKPYVGVGVSYILVLDGDVENENLQAGSPTINVSNGRGLIFQTGLSASITDSLSVNFDLKYSHAVKFESEIENMSLSSPTLGALIGDGTIERGSVDFELDAWVTNLSFQWSF